MTTAFLAWRERGGDPDGGGAAAPARRAIPHEVMGTALLVFTEIMFFCGLISSYLVLRGHADAWPPDGQPRLPILVTGLNTLALLASAYTVSRVRACVVHDQRAMARQWLLTTLILGGTFLAIQGYEWSRLLGFGLTTSSSLYGGIFYVVIGSHALHVVGAMVALYLVTRRLAAGAYTAESHGGLRAMQMFWYFVVAVWPILYYVVYLW